MKEHIQKVLDNTKVTEHVYRTAVLAVTLLFAVLVFSIVRQSFMGNIDPEKHIYFEIVFLLLMAVLAEVAVFYFKLQSVIVLMILGMLISPSFLGIAWEFLHSMNIAVPPQPPVIFMHQEIIHLFALLGAIILLFKVGVHSRIEKIFSRENLLVATAGILLPFMAGYAYAAISGGNFAYSMFMGAALAATSVGVTVGILREMNVLGRRYADIIIGAAVLDDILGLLLLSIVVNLSQASSDAAMSVARTFGIAVVFVAGAIISGKYFLRYLDSKEFSDKRFLLTLAFMLFFAYLAEVISLSAIVGAFLAGVILNKSRHYKEIEDKTYGLEYLFMPIFFLSLGILVDVRAIATFFVPIIIITVIAIASKMIGCGGTARLLRIGKADSVIIGMGMVPRGEVALIIASLGLSLGVLTQNEYSILSAMAILTSLIVPTILSRLIKAKSIN